MKYTEKTTIAATCTKAGLKTMTCSLCKHSYTEVIPALGHSFADGSCAACGNNNRCSDTIIITIP